MYWIWFMELGFYFIILMKSCSCFLVLVKYNLASHGSEAQSSSKRSKCNSEFFSKILILGKKSKNSSKIVFFVLAFAKNLIHWFLFFTQKWCITMYFTIVQKSRLWEKFGSSVKAKMLTANLIIVNYDHQYFWKEAIS